MNYHRYILEEGSKKHLCPRCGKKRFVRYIDSVDSGYLPVEYGRCDRESSCGYHLNPYRDGYINSIKAQESISYHKSNSCKAVSSIVPPESVKQQISYIPVEIFKQSRKHYDKNNFTTWLSNIFGPDLTSEIISRYHIGTSKHWSGSTIFWQIDITGKIRTGKIMLYDIHTGHRIKTPFSHITWVHKVNNSKSFDLEQCFFGEHLLMNNLNSPVGIVESEKTAVIASIYLPGLIWLAVGSLSNLTVPKFKVLRGRKVFLFPDLRGYERWHEKSKEIRTGLPGIHLVVSDLLEKVSNPSEKELGLDLADYLIKFDFHKFIVEERTDPVFTSPFTNNVMDASARKISVDAGMALHNKINIDSFPSIINESWPVDELRKFFLEITLPPGSIKLDNATTIIDIPLFVESSLEIIKAQNGKPVYRPYFDRLNKLKEIIQSHLN